MIYTSHTGVDVPPENSFGPGGQWTLTYTYKYVGGTNSSAEGSQTHAVNGIQAVTVPAGTFDAVRVDIKETVKGGSSNAWTNWYAAGVGAVKLGNDQLVQYSVP